jgi:hypothetical protein
MAAKSPRSHPSWWLANAICAAWSVQPGAHCASQGQPQKKYQLFVVKRFESLGRNNGKLATGNYLRLVFWKMMLTFAPRFNKKSHVSYPIKEKKP